MNNNYETEKYKQAEKKMVELLETQKKFYADHPEMQCGPVKNDELFNQSRIIKNQIDTFGEELAADPFFFDLMIHWMVDVKGRHSESSNEVNVSQLVTGNVDDGLKDIIDQQGSLAAQVQKVIESFGFKITDRGFGGNRWHVGVPCNEADARRLCCLLHQHFKKAIDAKAITIVRHFWGWRLPTIYADYH